MTLNPLFAEILAAHGAPQSREASCGYCQTVVPSDPKLPFFEDRGPGSKWSREHCRICKCYEVAHQPRGDDAPLSMRGQIPTVIGEPHAFEAMSEGFPFDSYYCGCGGWD
jgi:hypothetical protein